MALTAHFQRLKNNSRFTISDRQTEQLLEFVTLLDKWNKVYNLTAVKNPIEMLSRHIFDSLAVHLYLKGSRFIDVGTGPGLPGIPLAIVSPDKQFYLLDSLGKRVRFIRQVVCQLKLKNVIPVQSRVEVFESEAGFDGVLSRAFASLKDMLVGCGHLVERQQGCFYALKGQILKEELAHIPKKFVCDQLIKLTPPGLNAQRHLVILRKI